jgi:hypothetical protein
MANEVDEEDFDVELPSDSENESQVIDLPTDLDDDDDEENIFYNCYFFY